MLYFAYIISKLYVLILKFTLLFSLLSFPCSSQKFYRLNVDSVAVRVAGSAAY